MTKINPTWLTTPASRKILSLFEDNGHEIHFVGGCVRNALLELPTSDLDLATNARPDAVLALANQASIRAIPTGFEHGTITLVEDSIPYEITTYRQDVNSDGRHATVSFSDDIGTDAQRRDFTMNALYLSSSGIVQDPNNGVGDLTRGIVRFIGDAGARITEDYLRILRFFRFHAWYGDPGFGIEQDGLAACAAHLDGLAGLSKERVGAEFLKLLAADNPAWATASMQSSGVLNQIIPGASANNFAVLIHNEEIAGLAPDPIRRLAVLGGENRTALLRLSKSQTKQLARFEKLQMSADEAGYRLGADAASYLCVQATMFGQEVDLNKIKAGADATGQTLPVSSQDFIGKYQGAALGAKLKDVERRWIASGFTLSRGELLD